MVIKHERVVGEDGRFVVEQERRCFVGVEHDFEQRKVHLAVGRAATPEAVIRRCLCPRPRRPHREAWARRITVVETVVLSESCTRHTSDTRCTCYILLTLQALPTLDTDDFCITRVYASKCMILSVTSVESAGSVSKYSKCAKCRKCRKCAECTTQKGPPIRQPFTQ